MAVLDRHSLLKKSQGRRPCESLVVEVTVMARTRHDRQLLMKGIIWHGLRIAELSRAISIIIDYA